MAYHWRRAATAGLILAFLGCVGTGPAYAQRVQTTGNEMLVDCESGTAKYMCQAYIVGAIHGIMIMDTKAFCVSDAISGQQRVDVVLKYVRDHPETRHFHQVFLIFNAMAAAFPCSQK